MKAATNPMRPPPSNLKPTPSAPAAAFNGTKNPNPNANRNQNTAAGAATKAPNSSNPNHMPLGGVANRNSRWEKPSPTSAGGATEKPPAASAAKHHVPPPAPREPSPPPPTSYGFQSLDRRTIMLADGSVRTYFALPADFEQRFLLPSPPPWRPQPVVDDRLHSGEPSMKRKYGEESSLGAVGIAQRHEDGGRPGKFARSGGSVEGGLLPRAREVDPIALRRAYLLLSKLVNENTTLKKNLLQDGKIEALHCLVCGRASKNFANVHELVLHAYNPPNADMLVDHLGLHKALCVLMGWNYAKAPDSSKAYQSLSAEAVQANRDDVILWPPIVIIHNTGAGRRKDGRMDGVGNKEMDIKLKEMGFSGGKAKSIYGNEGHMGVTYVKFSDNIAGLTEAERLAEFFERESHDRKGWGRAAASHSGSSDDEKNPLLVKRDERTGELKRIFYGHLATAWDLEGLDFDTKKRATLKSKREFDLSD